MSLTLRLIKGSGLTYKEMDDNLIYLEQLHTGAIAFNEFYVDDVPLADANKGGMIMVIDEVGGYTPAFSDGTNWRRGKDSAIISS